MIITAVVAGSPPIGLHKKGEPPPADAHPIARLVSISSYRAPLNDEVANMTLTLDNGDGRITQLWGDAPPLRQSISVQLDGETLFDGVIRDLSLSEQATLQVET